MLDVDLERERVSLSLKATQEDPWLQFARAHSVGDVIEGRVTKLVPFGAFVEVDEAIEGLVHISELAEHHVERAEDEVGVQDRIPIKIIDVDLDRRRISLSRKQALREEGAPVGEPYADVPAPVDEGDDMELEDAAVEVETRAASEHVGMPAEDTIDRPESEAELESAAEAMPELAGPGAPETIGDAELAGLAAPPEEREEAEQTAALSPDRSPEGREHLTASERDTDNLDTRLLREEPDAGAAPGETVDEVASELEPTPVAEGDEAELPPDAGDQPLEPADSGDAESIESIMDDLRRERGQT